jgi:Zn finger protein HypA/HybF involved in hydrogenase expression
MIKYFFAAASVIFFVAAGSPSEADTMAIPTEKSFPSTVGEVIFHHQMHIKDLGIKCVECHHQIDAKKLSTPHPDYLKSSSINCEICHNESGKPKQQVYTCSACHHTTNPVNIADETLSAKVVIHKQCWKCHQVGTNKEASKLCEKCHSGKKTL